MLINKNLNNVIQGAVIRGQIAGAKSDGKVTTQEANALIARAKAGGVQPSELAALRQLALESRNNNKFDAGAKAALNNFLGNSADRSFASGRLPPEANLPQRLGIFGLGGAFDKARLAALDKHFKKDDGRIGQGEARAILRNLFKDGNISPQERSYLQSKLKDPNVSAEAKKDIRMILSLLPGGRITGDGISIRPPWPRNFPGLPPLPRPPRPPVIITPRPPTTGGTTPPPPATGGSPSTGTGGTTPPPSTGGTGSTGSTGSMYNGSFPAYPTPPKDPKDLAAQNKYQEDMYAFQQAQQQMNTFWTTMQNALKSMGEVAMGAARNLR
jgi:hypothetical protein